MNFKLKIEMNNVEEIYPKGLYFVAILPVNITFLQLHKVIMACTNYQDYHQWDFNFNNEFEVKEINKFDLEMRENSFRPGTKFPDLLEAKDTVIKDFFTNYDKAKYTYDYGDGNEFAISIVETYDFDLVPGVIEFAGKFPPEDVGFISGHFELVEAIKAGKNATEEQIEMREHYIELGYKNFDIKKANSRIAKIVL